MDISTTTNTRVPFIAPLITGSKTVSPQIMLDAIETMALHALSSLDEFDRGNYPLFDASIGDESCQTRGMMMLEYSRDVKECFSEARTLFFDLIDKVKKLSLSMNQQLNEKEAKADLAKAPIEEQRIMIISEKNNKLKNVQKRSTEYSEIVNLFNSNMKQLSNQEKPINELLNKECIHIKDAINALIPSLDIQIPKQVRQIILCYIVAKAKFVERDIKDPNYKKAHDKYKPMQLKIKGLNFDAKLFESISQQAKIIVSRESVDYLIDASKTLQGKRASLISDMMKIPMPSEKKLSEISAYHGCELVMKRARNLGFPVVVKSRDPKHEYDDFSKVVCYVPIENRYVPGRLAKPQPVLVIEGISMRAGSEGLEAVIDEVGGLMKMAKLTMAQHRLCTGHKDTEPQKLAEFGVVQAEIDRIELEREKAFLLGCSQKNMSNFLMEHIYADTLSYPSS